ncbi:MAG: universal stress protein [Chloroflexi bacterium]|nr:universal stress protein [Chloroflexota bacterium]
MTTAGNAATRCRLLRHWEQATALLKGDGMKIGKILVPVNGGPADVQAIQLACSVAKPSKGLVHAIFVIEVQRTLPLDADIQTEVEKGERVLDAAEQVAGAIGYEIESEILQAREIGPAVVDEAIERAVDVIIIGVKYEKRFGEFSLDRGASYVLKNAPCRVWVCREPMAKEAR